LGHVLREAARMRGGDDDVGGASQRSSLRWAFPVLEPGAEELLPGGVRLREAVRGGPCLRDSSSAHERIEPHGIPSSRRPTQAPRRGREGQAWEACTTPHRGLMSGSAGRPQLALTEAIVPRRFGPVLAGHGAVAAGRATACRLRGRRPCDRLSLDQWCIPDLAAIPAGLASSRSVACGGGRSRSACA